MAITSLADYEAARRDLVSILVLSTGSFTNNSDWKSISKSLSGNSEPPSFATVSNTTTGIVPVAGDTGFPALPTWSNDGYITHITLTPGSLIADRTSRVMLYDRLFHCGPFNMNNTSATLSSQPSYATRVPGGTDFTGLQIWMEGNNAQAGSPSSVTVTYTNQSGATGRSTSFNLPNSYGGGGNGWLYQVPLSSGDCGVQKIESISTNAVGSGTFNLFVARPLASLYSYDPRISYTTPIEVLGPKWIGPAAAFTLMGRLSFSSSSSPLPALAIEIASN